MKRRGWLPTYAMTETTRTNYPKKIGKILLKVILFLLLFIIVVFLLILTPPVQKFATGKVQNYLAHKLNTKVVIGGISFGLTGRIHLNNVYIEDQTKDTLVSGGSIEANVDLMKLFSHEVVVNDLALNNITTKIKRVLPDTAFNFQFIVNAFASGSTTQPDTTSAPLKLAVYQLDLNNVNVVYKDVITGNDMRTHVGSMTAQIDTMDLYQQHFSIPSIDVSNVTANIYQTKPLVEPKPLAEDVATATAPITMKLNLGTIDLTKIHINYGNDVSAFYTQLNVGKLAVNSKLIDLQNRVLLLNEINLGNSSTAVRMGNQPQAKTTAKEVSQKVQAQTNNNWIIRIANVNFDNDKVKYDDDSKPRLAYGMDYSHLDADSMTLHVKDVVVNSDSMAAVVTKGTMREKSGFHLNDLQADLLYASNEAYIKNLYLKTPGTELKRDVVLHYPSYKALTDSLSKVQMNIDIPNSYVQVKDILLFAPQLKSNPALADKNAVWHINMQANGNMNTLHVANLQFQGLSNTQIIAGGTLTDLSNPKKAGGNFTIKKFHTSQTDIALFTGQRLSNAQMNLPETFDITGTVNGNAGHLHTNMNLYTSSGAMALNGTFSNLTNMTAATYNATIKTNGLQVGSILRNPQLGSISATITATGKGFTPKAINTRFNGTVYSAYYNNYTYRNIALNGSLRGTAFTADIDSKDPNLYFTAQASGDMSAKPSFKLTAMVDSVKTMPLHFTTSPFIFHGQITADAPSIDPNNLQVNALITNALFVSDTNRLQLDSIQLIAGRTDTATQYISLKSDVMNAQLQGKYQLTELAAVFQNTLQPYFSTAAYQATAVHPYNFNFKVDVVNSPVLSSFVPGLNITDPIHAEGTMTSDNGLTASLTAPHLIYGTNDITNLKMNAVTTAAGLQLTTNLQHLKSGSSFDIYNTKFNATALHNIINFNLGVGDKASKQKYYLSGVVTQPTAGNYSLHLNPDSLLLNYQKWTVAPNNSISLNGSNILADNFILQQAKQQLAIQSISGDGNPLNVSFNNFELSTITGFVKADSVLVNGLMNGTVTLKNLSQQPVFTSNLTINDLSLRQDTIGNINLKVDNNTPDRYDANVTITGRGNDVALTGYFAPQGNDMALNLDLAVRKIELNTLNGALATAIKNATGTINGNVAIKGTTTAPQINGDLNFNNAVFNTVFLGGDFKLDQQKITVSQDGFHFNQFTIRDSANSPFVFDGTVLTTNFINYAFNLTIKADNFRAINTTKKDNKLYYGQLYLSTNLHVGGTESAPIVDGRLSVNDKTNFAVVIPQQEPGVVSRDGIVKFVDMNAPETDSLFKKAYDSIKTSSLIGYDINTNISINKNAAFTVVVDEANGDFLNVKGDGELTAGIDPSGKINMTGTYTLNEGAYELSFNMLHRSFTIQPGSKITWLGDPTSASLDVTAIYIANTAPLDLVEDQIDASNTSLRNTYMQKLPFQVQLAIGGELMQPQISFNIVLPTDKNYNVSSGIVQDVNLRLAQIRQEPSELNKQAFALLLLGRFVGSNPFQSSGGGGFNAGAMAMQSVSKILTQQLNQLASNLIQGVDLNFDVATTDDYTTGDRRERTDLNVGLSKRLLSNRLTVSVGSNFELQGPQNSNQQSSNLAGNINIQYQLSKDGRYMLRAYRKNDYEGEVDGYVIETGLGFAITMDYNHFREVLHGRKVKRVNNSEEEDTKTNSKK